MIDDGSNQPDLWLRERIASAAASLNGLSPELRKGMAHRTNRRDPTGLFPDVDECGCERGGGHSCRPSWMLPNEWPTAQEIATELLAVESTDTDRM